MLNCGSNKQLNIHILIRSPLLWIWSYLNFHSDHHLPPYVDVHEMFNGPRQKRHHCYSIVSPQVNLGRCWWQISRYMKILMLLMTIDIEMAKNENQLESKGKCPRCSWTESCCLSQRCWRNIFVIHHHYHCYHQDITPIFTPTTAKTIITIIIIMIPVHAVPTIILPRACQWELAKASIVVRPVTVDNLLIFIIIIIIIFVLQVMVNNRWNIIIDIIVTIIVVIIIK